MALTIEDRLAITELIALHGHFCDSGELARLADVFTRDVTYDLSDVGMPALTGLDAVVAKGWELGDANPVGHHVTNVVVDELPDGRARARSKGISIGADGRAGSVTYDDSLVRGPDGWRIAHRVVRAHRVPLGG